LKTRNSLILAFTFSHHSCELVIIEKGIFKHTLLQNAIIVTIRVLATFLSSLKMEIATMKNHSRELVIIEKGIFKHTLLQNTIIVTGKIRVLATFLSSFKMEIATMKNIRLNSHY
jgi:hypothetical protein